jgi:hypothetical protein
MSSRPSHPALNVRDDREAPLIRARDGGMIGVDLPDDTSGIFFVTRLDDPNQLELSLENRGFGADHLPPARRTNRSSEWKAKSSLVTLLA